VHALLATLTIVCIGGSGALGWLAWQHLHALEQVGRQLAVTTRIQAVGIQLQRTLVEHLSDTSVSDPALMAALRRELEEIHALGLHLHPETGPRLAHLRGLLDEGTALAKPDLAGALSLVEQIVVDESRRQMEMLDRTHTEARLELEMATAILIVLLLAGGLGAGLVSRRILRPLVGLREMFDRLGRRDYSPLALAGVDASLEPLFENYNRLVARLEELEADHRLRAQSLEGEVALATQTLLEQQHTLARSERLAAVGEVAARLAHELRNPLAAVQMTLANLRDELADEALEQRLELAMGELDRLTGLLNLRLSEARHSPEPPRPIHLRSLVDDLLALVRYQVPEKIALCARIEDDVDCWLPRDRLRQSLLNLVLNAVQAMGDGPGSIEISAQLDGDRLSIDVSDDGPGFPSELLASGPHPFVTRREGGTGLGLAVVRRFALDVGGELVLENLEPSGARARLVLPCSRG